MTISHSAVPAQAHRITRVRAALDEHKLDALLVTDQHSRRYLSGFTGSAGMLLIGRFESLIAADFRYWDQARQQATGHDLFKTVGPLADWFGDFVRPFGGRRIGFESASLSYDLFRQMRELIGNLPPGDRSELVPTVGLVEEMRSIKDAGEIVALERAIALGDAALASVAGRIEPGWTEQQVAWEIEQYVRTHGGDGMSFPTIVAGGPWGAMPHARARDVVLEEGHGVVIDMGVLLDGYCSDMTRTIYLGEPDPKFKSIYDIVLTAQFTAEELIEEGMEGEAAHRLAHLVIEEAGYGEQFGHGLGHGIGLQVHEAPRVALKSKDVLKNGMVFSVEPGIYLDGWGGVRIEDLVVLENGRCRVLTAAPKLRVAGG
ncbi:MAG: M24 family metallopeptidase [Dehalococcoidia bacterium]